MFRFLELVLEEVGAQLHQREFVTRNSQARAQATYPRYKGFGYVQNSLWPMPDPLAKERQILDGGKINVESLLLLEARPCARALAHWMGEAGRQAG